MKSNAIIAACILALHFVLYPTIANPQSLTSFGDLAQAIALVLAAIHFSRAANRATHEQARFIVLIALGLWVWFSGHLFLSYSELLLEKAATGTVADAIWLVGYVMILRSLYLMFRSSNSGATANWLLFISFVIVALMVYAILWEPLQNPEVTALVKGEQIIFPLLDFWICIVAFLLAFRVKRREWVLAGIGSLIIGITDLIFPYFKDISSPVYRYLDIPLFIGYSLWWLQGVSLANKMRVSTFLSSAG